MKFNDARQALFFTSEGGNKVRCGLCPHNCMIAPGCAGRCNVRVNRDGILYSTVWGHPGGINIDPIEKKPLYHFLPGSDAFSIGTAGCNLDCAFCQNHDLVSTLPGNMPFIPLTPETVVSRARANNCKTIAFTYNEPTVFAEYMMEIAQEASTTEQKCVTVTNGFISRRVMRDVYRNIQGANVDLKSFEPSFYKEYCKGRLEDVMLAIIELAELGVHLELTTLIIPDLNDRVDLMHAQAAWIRDSLGMDTPLHLSAFFPSHRLLKIRPTSVDTLETLAEAARDEGLRYVYVGNAKSRFNNTVCRKCGKTLIERQGLTVTATSLTRQGTCPACGTELPAVLF